MMFYPPCKQAFIGRHLQEKEKEMPQELTIAQKKEWAKLLFTKENLTQLEIAERVGVSRVTIGKWINAENWEQLKVSITITREEQLKSLYRQLAELNTTISDRPKGERFPSAAEADTISKLANAIQKMETEVGLANVISVFGELLKWLRTFDIEQSKQISSVLDAFVKSKLS